MEIKKIEDIILDIGYEGCYSVTDGKETTFTYKGVQEMLKFQAEQWINYIAENVDVDYEMADGYCDLDKNQIEVFAPKAQFEEFKKLIK